MRLTALADLFGPPLLSAGDGYALWAETYPAEAHNALMRAEQQAVEPMIRAAAPHRALDVGSGTGRYVGVMSAAGARAVFSIDLSMAMLARHTGRGRSICGDACKLPFADAAFDFVNASLMAGDVEDLGAFAGEIARVLAPGGRFVYSDFHPAWTSRRWERTFTARDGRRFRLPFHSHSTADHFRALGSHGLSIEALCEPALLAPDLARAAPAHRSAPVVIVIQTVKRRGSLRTAAVRR